MTAEPAYRTISDVAALVGVPHHVLRFWETRFPIIAPLKRGGNRRYYRPADVAAIERIARLLHVEGYTIKGVQKLLAEAPASGTAGSPVAAVQESAKGPTAASSSATGVTPSATLTASPSAAIAAIRADLAAGLAAARAL